MKTTLIIILAVIAYLFMGLVTWFLICLYERLTDGDNYLADDAEWMIMCMSVWVLILPIATMLFIATIIKEKSKNLIEILAQAIEDKKNNK